MNMVAHATRRRDGGRGDYIPGNPGVLLYYGEPPDDNRVPGGGPVRVGDQVTLSVRTVPTVLECYCWEYVSLRVTEALPGGRFAGVVNCRLMPQAFNPDVLAEGSRLTFGPA